MNLHTNHDNNKKLLRNAMEARKNKFEERRGGIREWQRFRISLTFEHRFVTTPYKHHSIAITMNNWVEHRIN